jgi:Mrp family chromosome partitioning ATPase
MSIFRKKKSEELPPLVLSAGDGTEWMSFPFTVVDSLRHMVAKVTRQETFPARLSLVASLRQEGVTYISRALGATMANDMELNICVIELNWWWPAQQPEAVASGPGLAAVLAGEATMEEALVSTGLPNLHLLPAGNAPSHRRAALARSTGLGTVINDLTRRFDHLLLDIPAALATNDAIPLASFGTACCLVLKQGVTPVGKARTALQDLDHIPNLGVVMNQVEIATPSFILRMVPQQ